MGITDSGRTIHAQAMASQTFHLAWGAFPSGYTDPWSIGGVPPSPLSSLATDSVVRSTTAPSDPLPQPGALKIISVTQGATTFVQGASYQLSAAGVDWSIAGTNPKPVGGSSYSVNYRFVTTNETSLLAEVGRRSALIVGYAVRDPQGQIIANDSSWTYTTAPTSNLYIQFKFDPSDGVGQIICQTGIFVGTVPVNGVPAYNNYLTPAQVANQGELYMIDNLEPFTRFAGKREVFEFVLEY